MSRNIVVFLTLLVFSSLAFSINVSSCQVISAPGTYDLINSFSGAPNPYYAGAYDACILINNTNSVVLDCHGYTITGSGGTAPTAVAVQNSTGVTVQNCDLAGQWGLTLHDSNGTTIQDNNVTASWAMNGLGVNPGSNFYRNDVYGSTYGFFNPASDSQYINNTASAGSVAFYGGSNSTFEGNYAYDSQTCFNPGSYANLTGNDAYNCSADCFYTTGTTVRMIGNTGDLCGTGARLRGASFHTLTGNEFTNSDIGIYLQTYFSEGVDYAFYNTISGNDVHDNNVGIGGYYAVFNNLTGNDMYDNAYAGLSMNYSAENNYVNNDAYGNDYGFRLSIAENETFTGNDAYSNDVRGFTLSSVNNSDFNGNSAYLNSDHGYYLSGSSYYNRMTGNDALNNGNAGIMLSNSHYNNLTGNNCSSNTAEGIRLSSSTYNRLTGNELSGNNHGLWLSTNSDFNTLYMNDAYSNGNAGFYLYSSQYTNITGNSLHDNNADGIEIYWNSNDAQLFDNEIYGNSVYGVQLRDSSKVALHNDHLYGNGNDLGAFGTALNLDYTMQYVVFDSDGTYTNYTNISLSDATNDTYVMDWDNQPAALPFPMLSFNQKFINISDTGSADTIDDIVWHWTNAELGGYDESRLQLWDYDGSWSLLNGTPDTVDNEFAIEDLSGFSTFAILVGGDCPAPITSAGTYTLTGDISGAPNDASPVVGTTCIKIASSDVVLDCDGYSITNNGTAGLTHGVVSNGTFTNVTVRNCPDISDYTRGVYYYQTSNSYILNSSAYNNAQHGFVVNLNSNNNVVDNCHAQNNLFYGFYLSNSDYNNLTGSTAVENWRGFWLQNSDYNRVVDSIANNNTEAGFMTTTSTGNVFVDSNATGPAQDYGFYLDRGGSHDVIGCVALHNDIGFYANQSNNNDFIDVNGSSCDDGLRLESATGNTVDPSYFCDNDRQGVYLIDSNNNTISDSTMCRNGDNGIYFETSSSNFILNNTVYENSDRGINMVDSSDGNNVTGNNVTDNNHHGIRLEDSDNNDIYENVMTLNSDGLYLRDSDYNNVVRNIANNNDEIGFRMGVATGVPSSSHNTLDNNTANNNGLAGIGGGSVSNNIITNNIANQNAFVGIAFVNESNLNHIENNTAIGNAFTGMGVQDNSGPNTFQNNYIEGSMYGLLINQSNATDSVDMEITQSSLSGVYMYDSDSSGVLRGHLYNNTVDMEVESAFSWGFNMRMDNVIFDNPTGNMTNYSNVSVDDFVENDGNHRFSWSAEPALPPAGYGSFAGKYLAFERFFGSPVIDLLTMSWTEAELAPGYTESAFVLASENGSWYFLNGTPDETNNALSFSGVDEDQTLGILEYLGTEDGGGDDEGPENELSMAFSSTCEANVITVTSDGSPVVGADIMVLNKNTLEDVASGTTDNIGEFRFMGCGIPIKIMIEAEDYQSYSTIRTMIMCSECELECGEDADCSDKEECKNNMCQRIECSCGYIEDHKCISYECCADSDCEALQACVDNVCVDHYECSSDDECEDTEYCNIAENATAGFCEEVTGQCGKAEAHAWVQYECGDEEGCPDCPEGYECDDNVCEPIRDIEAPDSGFVGEEVTVNATEAGGVCADCEVQIKLPDGKIINGKTDANGNLNLPLNLQGAYELTLLKDGEPIETVKVDALPKPVVDDEEPDTQVLDEAANVIFLVLLLTVLLAGIIYWRRGKQKK